MTDKFVEHRKWWVKTVWEAHVLPAMMLMAEQITVSAMQQVMIIGTFFDAKHQLESQRLLETLTADAHAAYHPSEGMCQFGTMTRSLANTGRIKDITEYALSARSSQRQALSGDGISAGGKADDFRSRFIQTTNIFCNPSDMGGSLSNICTSTDVTRRNNDVNFANIALNNNLDLDFTNATASNDEADIIALQSNLYGHRTMPRINEDRMSDENGNLILNGARTYMEMRAIMAKRSVAQASFAAYVAARAQSNATVQPYMEATLEEMGIGETEARGIFGLRPSYHTQMYFLTNTMYQSPQFYADLYDKPENVDRKKVSMQAINLKLRADMYDSTLRSNANQAVYLETLIEDIEKDYVNEANVTDSENKILPLPGLY